MPSFTFSVRDANGRSQTGTLPASHTADLVRQLRSRGWVVLEVRAAGRTGLGAGTKLAWLSPAQWWPATSLDVEVGLQQLAAMVRSGLDLLSALRTVAEQSRRPAMARVWQRVAEGIIEGASLAEALGAEGRRFSPLVMELVRMGEASGRLDIVLSRAAEHLEKARATRGAVMTALMYPVIVLVASLGVTLFMLTSVIPKLERFISRGGRRLPALTQALIDCTAWLHTHGPMLLLMLATAAAATCLAYRTIRGRLALDGVALRTPVVGGLLRLSGTAALARGLGLLLESSITLLDALEVARSLVPNRAMRRRVEASRQAVLEGHSFAEALRRGREFLPMLSQMAAIGETTGRLDLVLNETASFHEKQLGATIRRMSAWIEPVVIIIVGSIVGFVYLAFFLALFSAGGAAR
jgi:type IV pilus assembly protein PilC